LKRTELNIEANKRIKKMFTDFQLFHCECNLDGCTGSMFLTFAHRHKRRYYYDQPFEMLYSYNQVILACINCHQKIEQSAELTQEIFEDLRGDDELF
jgi:hypothetical protein